MIAFQNNLRELKRSDYKFKNIIMTGKTIITLGVVAALAGGVYFYMDMTEKDLSPEGEILKAGENMVDLDSFTMEMDVILDIKDPQSGEEFGLDLNTISNIDKKSEASRTQISGDGSYGGISAGAKGELTYVDDSFYGRIDSVPTALLMDFAPQAQDFIGKDILIAEDIKEELKEATQEEDFDEEEIEELMKIAEEILKSVFEEELVKVIDTESDEIDGKSATKYTVVFDYKEIPDFLLMVIEEYEDSFIFEDISKEEAKKEVEVLREEMEKLDELDELEGLEELKFYIWSDGDHILKGNFSFNLEEAGVNADISIYFRDFNEDFEIVAPEEYTTLEDLMTEIMGFDPSSMIQPSPSDFDKQEDIDEDEIMRQLEEMEKEMGDIEIEW